MDKPKVVAVIAICLGVWFIATPAPAHADTLCPYPGVGILGANVVGIGGGFCDFPTEINGAHWHCQGGGINLGGVAGVADNGLSAGANPAGVGGLSCNWRCPDGTDAPAPNPPGLWKDYLVPMNSTNFCRDHMVPNGFWSAPVLPTEGVPPEGFAPPPGAPSPSLPEGPPPPEPPPLAPGEPNP
jgi:hypothetical protein